MKIKKIEASSMQEALEKIKLVLGPDAVILSAKNVGRGGFLGLLGAKTRVEVTAAADLTAAEQAGKKEFSLSGLTQPAQSTSKTWSMQAMDEIQSELREIKSAIGSLVSGAQQASASDIPGYVGFLKDAYLSLIENEVEDETARFIVQAAASKLKKNELYDNQKVAAAITAELVNLIPVSGPLKVNQNSRRVVALIGPTGVGKTTTIAKLAATFSLLERKKVGLITADTYRIAAIEQLRTYSEIIGIPIEVVYAPKDMNQALQAHSEKDLVLIDTAGRNPRNAARVQELKSFVDAANPDEVHLVISSTTKTKDIYDVIDNFIPIGFDNMIFTKLDETTSCGVLLNALAKAQKPLSYIATGQNVPEDFEVANPGKLAALVAGAWNQSALSDIG